MQQFKYDSYPWMQIHHLWTSARLGTTPSAHLNLTPPLWNRTLNSFDLLWIVHERLTGDHTSTRWPFLDHWFLPMHATCNSDPSKLQYTSAWHCSTHERSPLVRSFPILPPTSSPINTPYPHSTQPSNISPLEPWEKFAPLIFENLWALWITLEKRDWEKHHCEACLLR